MAFASGGMPLLSGPPPNHDISEGSCRKCNKEFNLLFARSRKCNHCGYSYCHSCSDYQALMPRSGTESGYDAMPVCTFCVQYLTLTAGGKGYLRTMSLGRLKNYVQAYNIRLGPDILEKDDVINAIIAARNSNGCLPKANEDYYRKHSVPNAQTSRPRGLFSRSNSVPPRTNQRQGSNTPWNLHDSFPRPDLEPDLVPPPQPRTQNATPSASTRTRTTSAHVPYPPQAPRNPPQQQQWQNPLPPYAPYTSNRQRSNPRTNNAQRPPESSPRAHPPTPQPSPPPPTLDHLLTLDRAAIAAYPVSTLKAFLFSQHVPAPSQLVLEKSDLVDKVCSFVETERRERERLEAIREAEEVVEREERARKEGWNTWERTSGVGTGGGESGGQRGRGMDVNEGGPSSWEFERDRQRERERARARDRAHSDEPPTSAPASSPPTQTAAPTLATSSSNATSTPSSHHRHPRRARVDVEEEYETGSTYEVSVDGSESGSGSGSDVDAMDVREDGLGVRGERARSSTPTPNSPSHSASVPQPANTNAPPPPRPPPTSILERSGLCVVCQDEEANIVIVDCGHLALCRACSDLVMTSTRECPLCRTRIVTEARLLRVFKP